MLNRRFLLSRGALAAAGLWLAPGAIAQTIARPPRFYDHPFTLGVAAGEPAADGFVIWTKLAPRPLERDRGMPARAFAVEWEVAEDRGFGTVAAKGETVAWPELGHSARAVVRGLRPDRPYFYRFLAGGERSLAGRARTLPAPGAAVVMARLGVAGCQHYEEGHFTAFRHLAREDCHAIFHYGDYLYEYDGRAARVDRATGEPVATVRRHAGREVFSLDDYRLRYAEIKADTDLQAAHAAAAWLSSYDDHEVDNNWVGGIAEDGTPAEVFHLRRAAAMQAWYENMPLAPASSPRDGRIDAARAFRWGRLLDARVLDTRANRTDQPCGDRFASDCAAVRAPDAEVLGRAQEDWLVNGLARGGATWNLLLQQIMMMNPLRESRGQRGFNVDSWAGYAAPRDRLLRRLGEARVGNLVVLTGDEHQFFAGEVRRAAPDAEGPVSAIEFVTTSATSGGDGGDGVRADHAAMLRNPFLKFVSNQRGYSVAEVTPAAVDVRFRVVDTVERAGGQVATRASWRVPSGASVLEG